MGGERSEHGAAKRKAAPAGGPSSLHYVSSVQATACFRLLPLSALAGQTQRANPGGEERKSSRKWSGVGGRGQGPLPHHR